MSYINLEELKKKVTDRIISFWTGESNNPKVDTAKKISDLINELERICPVCWGKLEDGIVKGMCVNEKCLTNHGQSEH